MLLLSDTALPQLSDTALPQLSDTALTLSDINTGGEPGIAQEPQEQCKTVYNSVVRERYRVLYPSGVPRETAQWCYTSPLTSPWVHPLLTAGCVPTAALLLCGENVTWALDSQLSLGSGSLAVLLYLSC